MSSFLEKSEPEAFVPYRGQGSRAYAPTSGPTLAISKVLVFFLLIGVFSVSWHIARPGDINFTISDAALLVVLLGLVGTSRLNLSPMAALSPAWVFSLIVMLGALFVSTLLYGDVMRWLIVAVQYSFAFLLLPMIFASFDHRTLQRCVVFYVLGVTFSEAFGNIVHIFFDYSDTAPIFGNNFITGMGRLGAFSGNANNNSAMSGFALVLLFYVLDRRLMNRFLILVCGLFLLWGLIASASFGGFVICLSASALVMLIRWPQRAVFALLGVVGFAAFYISSGLPLPEAFEVRVYGALSGGGLEEAGTFTGRMELAEEAWRMAGDTLFIGIGADSFRVVSMHQAPVHVFPLLLLTEAGLPGLIGFMGLLGLMWFQAMAGMTKDPQRGIICVGVLLIFSLFTLTVPHMYARLWVAPVFLALLTCLREEEPLGAAPPQDGPGQKKPERPHRPASSQLDFL
ncbi:MAG: O-antigen ligase family protein [Erythrobacter sp.]